MADNISAIESAFYAIISLKEHPIYYTAILGLPALYVHCIRVSFFFPSFIESYTNYRLH